MTLKHLFISLFKLCITSMVIIIFYHYLLYFRCSDLTLSIQQHTLSGSFLIYLHTCSHVYVRIYTCKLFSEHNKIIFSFLMAGYVFRPCWSFQHCLTYLSHQNRNTDCLLITRLPCEKKCRTRFSPYVLDIFSISTVKSLGSFEEILELLNWCYFLLFFYL